MKIAIIGGGAAGMFCAANITRSDAELIVFESGQKLLRKVEQSGGGRCNITNAETNLSKFLANYPRGAKKLRKPLLRFGPNETLAWFEKRKVEFIAEKDGRIFPKSEDSLEIVNCLENACKKNAVNIKMPFVISDFEPVGERFKLVGKLGDTIFADIIVFATGGKWSENMKASLEKLGHTFAPNAPSLFAFKTDVFNELAGLSFRDAKIKAPKFNLESSGDFLITHEGLTGPAIFKMSALGAQIFKDENYLFEIEIDFLPKNDEFKIFCQNARSEASKKLVKNFYPQTLPKTFWEFALEKISLPNDLTWSHFSSGKEKDLEKFLRNQKIQILGKAQTSREFVSAGGVNLDEVDFSTMESKLAPNIFFAGECLDIDGFTGGFNLQAAWTTAFLAANAINSRA